MQGYATSHILNMTVQNYLFQECQQYFKAQLLGKIAVEEEEGLP